jgi:Tol biopolymer transport system component
MPERESLLCVRVNSYGKGEIWRVNLSTGVEECIMSDTYRSFSTPSLSPDGQWILCVGSSPIPTGKSTFWNTDIYVCRTDGTNLMQLTYHAADDLSPEWSTDGKYIYFISQRGSASGMANIWRMSFTL